MLNNIKFNGVYIEITNKCNLNCKYCYNSSSINNNDYFNFNSFITLINDLKEKYNINEISLSGGEPLLHPDILLFINELEKRKIKTTIITNGTLLNNVIINKVINNPNLHIQISIDGDSSAVNDITRGHGTFDKINKWIDILISKGISKKINFKTVINNYNYKNLLNLVLYSNRLNINAISFSWLNNIGRSTINSGLQYDYLKLSKIVDEIKELKDLQIIAAIEKFPTPCQYYNPDNLIITPRISVNGNVYACQLAYTDEFIIGNVNREKIDDIINGDQFKKLIAFLNKNMKNKECFQCNWEPVCAKGCPCMSIINGSIDESDGFCSLRKENFRNQLLSKLKDSNKELVNSI